MNDAEQNNAPLELIETIEAWRVWLTRAVISATLIVILAIILKFTLLAPVTELEYKIKVNRILKGDIEI